MGLGASHPVAPMPRWTQPLALQAVVQLQRLTPGEPLQWLRNTVPVMLVQTFCCLCCHVGGELSHRGTWVRAVAGGCLPTLPECPGRAPAPQGSAAFPVHTQLSPGGLGKVPFNLDDTEMGVSPPWEDSIPYTGAREPQVTTGWEGFFQQSHRSSCWLFSTHPLTSQICPLHSLPRLAMILAVATFFV